MIKIKCIVCGDEIISPRVDQLCCDKKKCKDNFNSNMIELWKVQNPERVKDMNQKAYSKRKENSTKPKGL